MRLCSGWNSGFKYIGLDVPVEPAVVHLRSLAANNLDYYYAAHQSPFCVRRRLARLAVAGSAAAPPSGRRAGLSIVAAVPSPAVAAKQEPQEVRRYICPRPRFYCFIHFVYTLTDHYRAEPRYLPSQIPTVLIDNMSDPLATIITVKFGDLLGELLDTVRPGPLRRSPACAVSACNSS